MLCEQQNTPFLQSQVLGLGFLVPFIRDIFYSWQYSKYWSFIGILWCLIKIWPQPVLWGLSVRIIKPVMLLKSLRCCWIQVELGTGVVGLGGRDRPVVLWQGRKIGMSEVIFSI